MPHGRVQRNAHDGNVQVVPLSEVVTSYQPGMSHHALNLHFNYTQLSVVTYMSSLGIAAFPSPPNENNILVTQGVLEAPKKQITDV